MENNKISDQLIAAYLDGNTTTEETFEVLSAISVDPVLQETMEIASVLDNDYSDYEMLPMEKMAAESGNNICSTLCEAFILHRRNIPFDEAELLKTAQDNHWLTPQGTPLHSIGQLLAFFGLMVTRKYDATLDDIRNALSLDNDILVVVDSDKLFPDLTDDEDEPNHAVVVTAICDGNVTVFDPKKISQFSIPNSQFERAWNESHNYMVRVLQTIDDYEPQPIYLEDIQLTDDLQELKEAIAENAHEVWAAARKKEGWTFGHKRDDTNKRHPDLIPYSSLPDSEKEYDRQMAIDTIKLVKKLGFDIVKKM